MADDQAAAIEFLSRGKDGEAKPRRIDTHSSIVFLAGDRVFKIKRAVKYSFLDYSTLADRQRYCRAEFDLNRRTAPALYRGVHLLTRAQAGGIEWDGAGEPVEAVLEMARFADDALFDRLAETGRLTPALMVKLGDIVAAFHDKAEETPRFGGRDGIAAVIADNHENLIAGSPPLSRERVVALRAASTQALARHGESLDERRRRGRVRRCHGDLHLRNICLFNGEPTLFDCIEFSDDIACIDTLYDFAFLLMDIEHRRLRPLGNIVFNRYFDRSDEMSGLAALPLLMSVRAGVRAKVASAAAESAAYLDLALALLQPAAPRLVAVGRLSGSGKSTVAAGVAGDFAPAPGARHIRSDVLRKTLTGVAPETRLPAPAYSPEMSARVYRTLRAEAAASLAAGYTAVVDATFMDPAERAAIAEVAAKAGTAFTGLWLTAPDTVLLERVAKRRGDASDADQQVLKDQLRADVGTVSWGKIDVSGDIGATLAAARRAVAMA
ncbi:MAG TPA: AAA family ATPase [Stellaceae bacterium]|nr:AAA family ATPase [Stellaceae bacterium]